MNRFLLTLSFATTSLVLLSCGGGGSGSSGTSNPTNPQNPSTPGQAQGVYVGNTSTGLAFDAIVLPNDKFYAVYGNLSGNVLFVCGLAAGQGASSSGTYTATETDFYYCGGALDVYSGNVSATYAPESSLNGSISENGDSETFTSTAPAPSLFNYNNPASLAGISGPWNGSLTDGESASLTINSSGSASGISSLGCSYTATIAPDSSNKNFFDVSLTFGGSPCDLPNQSATGIAVNYLLSDGVTNQFVAAVSSGSAFGIVFAAQRITSPPPVTVITGTSGSPQSAQVNTPFTAPLVATVTQGGAPVTGASVTFTAPSVGASGAFADGTTTMTATTNSSGVAVSSTFTANSTAGSYNVSATVSGALSTANFSLTNLPAPVETIIATSGTPQTATVSTSFAGPLVAAVTTGGTPTAGVAVTFTAPSNGASGTFSNGLATETDTTNSSGVATSTTFTANSRTGAYFLTATAVGASSSATFGLTNSAPTLASGNYVFSLSGADKNGFYTVAGAFTLASDGATITSGEQDFNDPLTGDLTDLIASGTITTSLDGNLIITLTTCTGTNCAAPDPALGVSGIETIDAALVSSVKGLIVEYDSSASSSGELDLQSTTMSSPVGGYAFFVGGVDSSGNPLSIGGIINVDGIGTISGAGSVFDMNNAPTLESAQLFAASTVTGPDSFGRLAFSMHPNNPSIAAFGLAGYIIDGSRMRLVQNLGAITGGTALSQGGNTGTFSSSSLSGNYILGVVGSDANGTLQVAGLLTPDSGGTIGGVLNFNDLTAQSPQGGSAITSGNYAVDSTGRVTVTSVTGSGPSFDYNLQLYLNGSGQALVISVDTTDALGGYAYRQASSTFTAASFNGSYAVALGQSVPAATSFFGAQDGVGRVNADGTSTLSGSLDINESGNPAKSPTADVAITGSFAAGTTNGIFTGRMTDPVSAASDNFTYYIIDTGQIFAIETDAMQLSLGTLELE
jgi:hypothetical protein